MPDKVLLVCSSTADNIRKAREILCGRTPSDRPELHLLCSPSDLPYLRKEPPAGQIWVFPHRQRPGRRFQAVASDPEAGATGRWRSSGAARSPACAPSSSPWPAAAGASWSSTNAWSAARSASPCWGGCWLPGSGASARAPGDLAGCCRRPGPCWSPWRPRPGWLQQDFVCWRNGC